jgi:DNA-binding NarL/FixJ family response regulator
MNQPRVVLADDHSILLEGLRQILEPAVDLVGPPRTAGRCSRWSTSSSPKLARRELH